MLILIQLYTGIVTFATLMSKASVCKTDAPKSTSFANDVPATTNSNAFDAVGILPQHKTGQVRDEMTG